MTTPHPEDMPASGQFRKKPVVVNDKPRVLGCRLLKEARRVCKLWADGYRQVDIAAKFGVSQRVISLICRGESYKEGGVP